MVIDSSFYMKLALCEAWKYQGLTYPNPAVGCCVVSKSGKLLSVEAHHKAGTPHAEVNALKSAYYKLTNNKEILSLTLSQDIHNFLLKNHEGIFKDSYIYTTLEPCSHIGKTPSCASLISKLSIKKLFVGSQDFNEIASNGNEIVKNSGVEIINGVLKKECDELLEPFKKWQNSRFVFFKMAQRLDGSTDGVVSSEESRKNVHAMRDVCDLLVIGGNTVRNDRPTLDARLVDGKAPDILIISRQKEFDKTIPLFNVEDREVFIEDNFKKLDNYKNIMIEGTKNMFELSKPYIDYSLTYMATNLDVLNIQKDTKDIILWMKMGDR
ncbi:MAG: bifunctional diaminohydroxyphosphoribosylaminopyrimidine deaminase/5-amino-6-(5-phosphoribosylamino)uracil reductase RibD [Epsilonproteobacteria bacterium]|nr:bifunctional diaminohydroxyphosphoribosylaminopyrimidine deaminase/5-amino-6-(5-phosphoribosylamino)uracil reductase RibD [Campylobacterota bacterium]